MNGLNYPLEQLMTIKKNRYDQALRVLEEKRKLLAKEEQKLRDVEQERDKVLEHKNDKLKQLRDALDEGTTSDKIQQMKVYLKVVDDRLAEHQKKVKAQKDVVEKARQQVELAKADLLIKQKDLEKMEIHKKEWEKEIKYWMEQQESLEHDELGSASHVIKNLEKEQKKRSSKTYE